MRVVYSTHFSSGGPASVLPCFSRQGASQFPPVLRLRVAGKLGQPQLLSGAVGLWYLDSTLVGWALLLFFVSAFPAAVAFLHLPPSSVSFFFPPFPLVITSYDFGCGYPLDSMNTVDSDPSSPQPWASSLVSSVKDPDA